MVLFFKQIVICIEKNKLNAKQSCDSVGFLFLITIGDHLSNRLALKNFLEWKD